MLKTYSGTQYILRHLNGNGELCDRYETLEAAKEGRAAAMEREKEYRKKNHYSFLEPSKYAIIKSTWIDIYDIKKNGDNIFISHSLNETVIPED